MSLKNIGFGVAQGGEKASATSSHLRPSNPVTVTRPATEGHQNSATTSHLKPPTTQPTQDAGSKK
jgi:hypothetical protein